MAKSEKRIVKTGRPLKGRVAIAFQRVLSYFPLLLMGLVTFLFYKLIQQPSLTVLFLLFATVYGLPLALFRLINLFAPIPEGYSYISAIGYSPWVAAMKIQAFYTAFPVFERVLLLIPGAFSLWLRLWGSRVGKFVYWTPGVEVVDRTHLKIGDGVVFGNKCYLSPHVVRSKNGRILLYFKTITIGDRAMVGFSSKVGPGVTVGPGEVVPASTILYPNQSFFNHNIGVIGVANAKRQSSGRTDLVPRVQLRHDASPDQLGQPT